MKVLFIYSNIGTMNVKHYPFPIGVLSAIIKGNGHQAEMIYLQDEVPEKELLADIGSIDPDLIAFTVVTHQWETVKRYVRMIRTVFQAPIICGGPHPTYLPETVIAEPGINMVCVGEGDLAIVDLLQRMETGGDLSSIPNIWAKNENGDVFRNEIRPLVKDLDGLPFPDRQIVPFQEIIDSCNTEPVFMASRGCPYNCTFCSNSAIKKLYAGKGVWVRKRSPQNVIDEIGELRSRYRFETANFYDECFGYDRKWLRSFCELYKREFGYPFGCFIRAETMDRDGFKMLRKAGLSLIYLGIESGNETLRRKVMNRQVSDDRIIQACRDAQAEGIQVWTYNIVGIPGETVDTIKEAMELNRLINPNFVSVSIFQPLPGTQLYEECIQHNYITRTMGHSFYEDSALDLPTIKHADLISGFKAFQKLSEDIRLAHEIKGEKIFLADI